MRFYAHAGTSILGSEPCGSNGRFLFELKTTAGAIRRCRRVFGDEPFRLYSFSSFCDDSTFRLLFAQD